MKRYSQEDEAYVLWAAMHGGSDREIAHDLGRTVASVNQKVRDLRKDHEIPDRRKVNSGTKKLRSAGTHTGAQRK